MSLITQKTNRPIAFDTRVGGVVYYDEHEDGATSYRGHLEPIPSTGQVSGEENENSFACGGSGSGKSTIARTNACNYHRMFPRNSIFLITQSDETNIPEERKVFYAKMPNTDVRYNEFLKLKRIQINDDFIERKIDVATQMRNSLVIFDDFLYFEGQTPKDTEALRNKLCSFASQILNLGRKIGVSCFITSHLLTGHRNNDFYQNIYGEIHKFYCNPLKGNRRQISDVLSRYLGLTNKEIRLYNRFDADSHWTMFNRYPRYFMSENKVVLLKDLD